MPGMKDLELVIFDGACGTNLQNMAIPASAWGNNEGCNEYLNLTAGDIITELHRSFLDVGAHVLETNTFGASSIVLAEYGLEDKVAQINTAAVEHARRAINGRPNCFIAGSVGPTTKIPTLGHITVDELEAALKQQIEALVAAGVDCVILETCQDLLQLKIALRACFDVLEKLSLDLPVLVSVTIEQTGTMLVGTDIAAVAATVEPFDVFSLGLNCATGPADMESHIRYLSHQWPGRISCIPNQGLPEVIDGRTAYQLSPQDFARQMTEFVRDWGVTVVGGCCGTTPEHIRCLVKSLTDIQPAPRSILT
jgi:methionine synthase I (cobalamin-dependent)